MEPVINEANNSYPDEVTILPFKWEERPAEYEDPIPMHCWGIDRDNNPVLLKTKITHSVYLKLPRMIGGKPAMWRFQHHLLVTELRKRLDTQAPVHWELVERDRLYFFSKIKSEYLYLTFPNTQCVRALTRLVSVPLYVKSLNARVSLAVNEAEITPIRRLQTIMGVDPSQWFKCSARRVPDEERISTLEHEYEFNWSTMKAVPYQECKAWSVNPGVGSFDIEAYSKNERAFPKSDRTSDMAYMITYVYQRVAMPNTRRRYCLVYVPDDADMRDWVEEKIKAARNTEIIIANNELDVIRKFCELVCETDPEIVTGYNILSFDYMYLNNRLKRFGETWPQIGRIVGEAATVTTKRWSSSAYGYNEVNILNMDGRISIDMLPVVKREHKLPKYDLNTVSHHFLDRGKHDVSAKDMFRIFNRLCTAFEDYKRRPKRDDSLLSVEYEVDPALITKIKDMIVLLDDDKKSQYVRNLPIKVLVALLRSVLADYLKVLNYAVEDSELVIDLFAKLNIWVSSVETSNVEGVGIMELSTRGQQIRGLFQLSKLAHRRGIVIDHQNMKKQPYKGAIVQHPIPGLYRNIICLDFASLYPSIIQAYNLCWSTFLNKDDWDTVPEEDCHIFKWEEDIEEEEEEDGPDDGSIMETKKKKKVITHVSHEYRFVKPHIRGGVLCEQVKLLVDERNHIRQVLMKAEKDPKVKDILDKRQLATKVSANSKYGILGAQEGGLLPLVAAAAVVTYIGRTSITLVNDYLKKHYNAKVVYGDTDSTMVDLGITDTKECNDRGYALSKEVSALFMAPMKLEFEKAMIVMLCIAPKKYAAILADKDGRPIIYTDAYLNDLACVYKTPRNVLAECSKIVKEFGHRLTRDEIFRRLRVALSKDRYKNYQEAIKASRNGQSVYSYSGQEISASELWCSGDKEENDKLVKASIHKRVVLFDHDGIVSTFEDRSKMYSDIFYESSGEYAIDSSKFLFKGIILARRDNCKRQRTVYRNLLIHILVKGLKIDHAWYSEIRDATADLKSQVDAYRQQLYAAGYSVKDAARVPLIPADDREVRDAWRENVLTQTNYLTYAINLIFQAVKDLLTRSVPWTELTFIRGVGSNYKSDTYFMKVFSDELSRIGKPVQAGDRIDYLIVKSKSEDKELLGYKMRTPDVFIERLDSDEPETVDYMYYIEKVYMNCLEQLIQVGFQDELNLLDVYHQALGKYDTSRMRTAPPCTRITTKPIKKVLKFIPKFNAMISSIPSAAVNWWRRHRATSDLEVFPHIPENLQTEFVITFEDDVPDVTSTQIQVPDKNVPRTFRVKH